MRKGHTITGLQVLALDNAADLGHVLDLVFDHDADECLGILLRENSMFHAAQVVPWSEIRSIGKDAVMIESEHSVMAPGDDARLSAVMERDTHLSGTRILTETGDEIGSFSDIYLDENTGRVIGYETSGGLVSDTMSGKRYIPAEKTGDLHVGDDVLMVDPQIAGDFERQAEEEPGGIKGALHSATDKVSDTYHNIADASVDKQKEFVVGKKAGRDVYLPAPTGEAMDIINEDQAMVKADNANLDHGPLLVAKGDIITAEQADTATKADILSTLVTVAGGGVASNLLGSAQDKLGDAKDSARDKLGQAQGSAAERGSDTQENLLQKAVGQPAGTDVDLKDGSTLVAAGMTITQEIVDRSKTVGKEKEVIASAGLGTASVKAQDNYDAAAATAGDAWDTVKDKTADLTDSAKQKKSELDDAAQKRKINHALGRPITRIVLAQDDTVILNTGDIITHKAIRMGRDNGVMDVILDSVYDQDPDITPEMARATQPGAAALPSQAQPTGHPITATVTPDQPSQDQPSQGER